MKLFHLRFRVKLCLILLFPCFATANVRLPTVLADNMVLQRNSTVKLWGWSNPAEKVIITNSWNNKVDSVTASGDARWSINIATGDAGGPYSITLRGDNMITLKNVMLGEVWICSGQSNMEWSSLQNLKQMLDEMPTSANPNIRLFNIPKTTSQQPQDDCVGKWDECGPESLKGFSAIGYFFGKKLYEKLKVPIGLVNSSWGGTPAEPWTPAMSVTGDEQLRVASLKIAENPYWPTTPGKTYNAMISPLTGFNIAGAIWYQGESNTLTYNTYQLLLTNMIAGWRQAWNKEFPFYLVQIAPYSYGNKNVGALLREAQTNVQGYPKTGMVVITDLVDNVKDIHPQNKRDVADRLANLALADHYKLAGINYKSPQFKKITVNKNIASLEFENAPNGFMIKGPKALEWFVAGPDKQFYPADVKLQNNTILVSSKQVKAPVAVRFAFSNEAIGNIFSKEGLPMNPFRTDDWEMDVSAK
jgi:sialate O-acetylesterase